MQSGEQGSLVRECMARALGCSMACQSLLKHASRLRPRRMIYRERSGVSDLDEVCLVRRNITNVVTT